MEKSAGTGPLRESLMRAGRNPLGFFTLLVLVAEAILLSLVVRAEGADFTALVYGMQIILFASLVAVLIISRRGSVKPLAGTPDRPILRYDVFLSSVLAGFADDSRLLQEKETALAIVKCLEQECRFSVYYAGRDVKSTSDFDGSHLGAKEDISALSASRYFILLYPERITSSVLFEAGFALNHCDASIYFVRDVQHLPYLMRRLPDAVTGVKIFTYRDTANVLAILTRHRKDLFRDISRSPELGNRENR